MPRVKHVKARKDYPSDGIKKGQKYYTWMRFGQKQWNRSLTSPKRSQLTSSHFLGSMYDAEDQLGYATMDDNLTEIRDEVLATVEELKDEAEENLEAIPEQFRDEHMLAERVTSAEDFYDLLDGFDYDDPDEPDEPNKPERKDFINVEIFQDAQEIWSDEMEEYTDEYETWESEKQAALDELQGMAYEGE